MSELNFDGGIVSGTLDLDSAEMVCVPAKKHYNAVDLCFLNKPSSMNISVLAIDCDWLDYENKRKLGYEVERRWNAADRTQELEHALTQVLELSQRDSEHFGGKRNDISERVKETLKKCANKKPRLQSI